MEENKQLKHKNIEHICRYKTLEINADADQDARDRCYCPLDRIDKKKMKQKQMVVGPGGRCRKMMSLWPIGLRGPDSSTHLTIFQTPIIQKTSQHTHHITAHRIALRRSTQMNPHYIEIALPLPTSCDPLTVGRPLSGSGSTPSSTTSLP